MYPSSFLVVTPLMIMAASVCTCLWRDVHYHGTQPIQERTCCVMGALFILFQWISVYDISRAASVGPEKWLTTEALFFKHVDTLLLLFVSIHIKVWSLSSMNGQNIHQPYIVLYKWKWYIPIIIVIDIINSIKSLFLTYRFNDTNQL